MIRKENKPFWHFDFRKLCEGFLIFAVSSGESPPITCLLLPVRPLDIPSRRRAYRGSLILSTVQSQKTGPPGFLRAFIWT